MCAIGSGSDGSVAGVARQVALPEPVEVDVERGAAVPGGGPGRGDRDGQRACSRPSRDRSAVPSRAIRTASTAS